MNRVLSGKILISVCFSLIPLLFSIDLACAQRSLDEVTPTELGRLGYRDRDELVRQVNRCTEIQIEAMKGEDCSNGECVKTRPEWISGNCDRHTMAMFYLTSLVPPGKSLASVLTGEQRTGYLQSYAASCQQGYKAANPGGDIAKATAICACAANQSMDLIEYGDFKAFESKTADREVMDGIKSRAAFARFICENRGDARSGQLLVEGATSGVKSSAGMVPAAGRQKAGDARLHGMFDQLQKQGVELYSSLLAKLNAESIEGSCRNDAVCTRLNETLGAVYREVLYTVYAMQLYNFSSDSSLASARGTLRDFLKVALLSVDRNVRAIHEVMSEAQKPQKGDPLLSKTVRDAEECQKLMLAISRELDAK